MQSPIVARYLPFATSGSSGVAAGGVAAGAGAGAGAAAGAAAWAKTDAMGRPRTAAPIATERIAPRKAIALKPLRPETLRFMRAAPICRIDVDVRRRGLHSA